MFPPVYFGGVYFPFVYFPPSSGGGPAPTAIANFYKQDIDIYISKASSASADATNTVCLSVEDFSYNRPTISRDVDRVTIDPAQDRTVDTYIAAVAPVEFTFTTYISPILDGSTVTSPEENLWVSLMGTDTITNTVNDSTIDFADSANTGQLQELTLWFNKSGTSHGNYRLDNAVIDSANISFDINNLAKIEWRGRAVRILATTSTPACTDRTQDIGCIKNKLTTITVEREGTAYDLPLIGGSIEINNNNTFYGRAKLGETTVPEGHYTGNRTIKGTFNVYTKAGTLKSGQFLGNLYSVMTIDAYERDYKYDVTINVGGTGNPSLNIDLPAVLFDRVGQVFNDVISTELGFTVQERITQYMSIVYNGP